MDKRECRRKLKRFNIYFSNGEVEHCGITSNLSCRGIFIRTRKSFSFGTSVEMKLEIANGSAIHLKGTVVRSDKAQLMTQKTGMGIKLNTIPAEYKKFIDELYRL